MFDPSLWYLLPVGVIISTLGMSSGVSGSNFWIPVYLVWLRVDPKTGFWLGLLTMTFGFGSGVWKNWRQGTIDGALVRRYAVWCVPAGVIGGYLSPRVNQQLVMVGFAIFVTVYGLIMVATRTILAEQEQDHGEQGGPRRLGLGMFAAFLQGLIATGLGALLLPQMLREPRVGHHARAVGSTVLVVFLVTLAAVVSRLNGGFLDDLIARQEEIIGIMMWTAPAVLIGGQVGPVVAKRLPKKYLKPYVGCLLLMVGALMMIRAFG